MYESIGLVVETPQHEAARPAQQFTGRDVLGPPGVERLALLGVCSVTLTGMHESRKLVVERPQHGLVYIVGTLDGLTRRPLRFSQPSSKPLTMDESRELVVETPQHRFVRVTELFLNIQPHPSYFSKNIQLKCPAKNIQPQKYPA